MSEKIFGKAQTIPFTQEELARRLANVRAEMAAHHLDALFIRSAESVTYLTGMNHYGFFAEHALLVPLVGEMRLVARETETVTFNTKVQNAMFCPYFDHENSWDKMIQVIKDMKLENARWGMEKDFTSSIPFRVIEHVMNAFPNIKWEDFSESLMLIRITQSEAETAYTREAGRISQMMVDKVVELAKIGAQENEIIAEVMKTMAMEGGEYPGFPPFVRFIKPGQGWMEHVAWGNNKLIKGDNVWVELSACINMYHAPMGRMLFTEEPDDNIKRMGQINTEAFLTVAENLKEGNTFGEVYDKWRAVLDRNGLEGTHYRRHCGYVSGLSYPPSWCGGRTVISLQHSCNYVLKKGMVFHIHTSMYEKGKLEYMITNACVTGDTKGELLNNYTYDPIIIR